LKRLEAIKIMAEGQLHDDAKSRLLGKVNYMDTGNVIDTLNGIIGVCKAGLEKTIGVDVLWLDDEGNEHLQTFDVGDTKEVGHTIHWLHTVKEITVREI
jgi:hypothetical protein